MELTSSCGMLDVNMGTGALLTLKLTDLWKACSAWHSSGLCSGSSWRPAGSTWPGDAQPV